MLETGQLLADSLAVLLQNIEDSQASVTHKDIQIVLNESHVEGNPKKEFSGQLQDSTTFKHLKTLCNSLRNDPTTRTFLFDSNEESFTEDAVWLSIPKWQASLGSPSIYWHVVTQRSIEKPVFQESFQDGWRITNSRSPPGTTFLTKPRVASKQGVDSVETLFSDQPRIIASYGQKIGSELWEAAKENDTLPKVIVRVFRCGPRPCLNEGIARVFRQERTDNVVDIWIRHHETSYQTLGDLGRYKYTLDGRASLLDKLTGITMSDDEVPSPFGSSQPLDSAPVASQIEGEGKDVDDSAQALDSPRALDSALALSQTEERKEVVPVLDSVPVAAQIDKGKEGKILTDSDATEPTTVGDLEQLELCADQVDELVQRAVVVEKCVQEKAKELPVELSKEEEENSVSVNKTSRRDDPSTGLNVAQVVKDKAAEENEVEHGSSVASLSDENIDSHEQLRPHAQSNYQELERTVGSENTPNIRPKKARVAKLIKCGACGTEKPKSEFSKTQLRKKTKRCMDCIQTGQNKSS